jgi:toxin ParE1/3/4
MRCTISPLAESDLEEIGDYNARDNPHRAISFIQEIKERCFNVSEMPESAPLREKLGEGIRMVPFGRYLIFYTIDREGVRIERILHGARNIPILYG